MGRAPLSREQLDAIKDAIERLVAIVDQIEGDADLEPSSDDEEGGDDEREEGQ